MQVRTLRCPVLISIQALYDYKEFKALIRPVYSEFQFKHCTIKAQEGYRGKVSPISIQALYDYK